MLGIHTILHPTDFSTYSDYAFRLACALARDYNAHLIVAHVAPQPVLVYGEGVIPLDYEEDHEELRHELMRITPTDPGIDVEHRLLTGDFTTEILRVANDAHCDLIVMGTHGRRGIRRLLMGSVAEQILRRASCPVLTVKSPVRELVTAGATEQHEAAGWNI